MTHVLPATVCRSGHTITAAGRGVTKHCSRCGKEALSNCESCGRQIPGIEVGGAVAFLNSSWSPPAYCAECGTPFPWTASRLKAAQELADELDDLASEDREAIKSDIETISTDTPETEVASVRLSKMLKRVSGAAADQLRRLIVDIASETAKKILTDMGR